MPTPTSKMEFAFVPGQFYFGETEIEIGGMEICVQYHFLPKDPDEFAYNDMEAEEVHFKGLDLKLVIDGKITWIDILDLMGEIAQGDLDDLLHDKLDDLLIVYVPNDRPVGE
jgi:hypothetical protein